MEEYKTDIEIFHSTQFIKKLIDEGKITFKEKKIKVTYHDPCDLGRASGVYEAPREILRAIPGVELVEMENNREQCKCCGGGGNLEMVDPELSAALAQEKINQIQATGADTVITACQQCVRTILTTATKKRDPYQCDGHHGVCAEKHEDNKLGVRSSEFGDIEYSELKILRTIRIE